jgi:hypothetical protein
MESVTETVVARDSNCRFLKGSAILNPAGKLTHAQRDAIRDRRFAELGSLEPHWRICPIVQFLGSCDRHSGRTSNPN